MDANGKPTAEIVAEMVDAGDTPKLARAFGNGQDIVMVYHQGSGNGGKITRKAERNDVNSGMSRLCHFGFSIRQCQW